LLDLQGHRIGQVDADSLRALLGDEVNAAARPELVPEHTQPQLQQQPQQQQQRRGSDPPALSPLAVLAAAEAAVTINLAPPAAAALAAGSDEKREDGAQRGVAGNELYVVFHDKVHCARA
jgi:hypothetical protein